MAGESVVGALRVILGMDTAQYEDKLKGAEKKTSSFVKSITAVAAGISLERHLTSAIESFVGSFKRAITEAEKFGEMAQQFGVTVEELSSLKHAADLSGVSIDTLGTSLGRMSKALFEAADGTGPTAIAFRALGVEIKNEDGTLKSNNETLLAVSEAFSKMQDGAQKTALAMAIFGRGGAALLPLLNQGSEALRKQTEEARAFGLVISTQTAVAADAFMDTLDRIGKVWVGSVNVAIAQSLPLLQVLANQFLNLATVQDTVQTRGQLMADLFSGLALRILNVVENVRKLDLAIQATGNILRQVLIGTVDDVNRTIEEGGTKWRTLTEETAKLRAEMFLASSNISLATVQLRVYGDTAGKAAVQSSKLSAAARDLIRTTSEKEGQVPAGQSTLDKIGQDMLDLPEKAAKAKRAYSELTDQTNKSAELGSRIRQELATPFDEIGKKIVEADFALATFNINAEEHAARLQQLAIQTATAWGNVAQSIVGPMADAFKTLASMNKQYAGVAKGLAIAEALINTYLAATKALASGIPPFNYIAAAAVTAAGLANVAKIQATEFASGGSFRVGGVGGIDSQLVQFKATPGEMVDVRKPGQTSPSTVNLTLTGDRVRVDDVRSLIDTINGAIRDGYRINFATV